MPPITTATKAYKASGTPIIVAERARLREVEQGDDGREHPADREREPDHDIAPDAEILRHAKIFGGGAHLHAERACA